MQSLCWSPDGTELLLRGCEEDYIVEPSVYLVPRLGGQKIRKFDTPGSPEYFWDIAWLPDGTGFVSIADHNRLFYTDKETGDTSSVPFGREFRHTEIGNFSPDGRWLVISGATRDDVGVWLISRDGEDVHGICKGLYTDPVWSPLGDAVYAMEQSFAPGSERLWRFEVDNKTGKPEGKSEILLSGLPNTLGMSVSRSGKKLLSRQYHYSSNLWRVLFDPQVDPASQQREEVTSPIRSIIV